MTAVELHLSAYYFLLNVFSRFFFIPSLTSSMKPKMLSSASVKLAGD